MKNYLLYGILSVFLLSSCTKEDRLEATMEGTDWFQIQDKSGRFNHLAYEIYKATGMPMFVNDTIGLEDRGVDAYGNRIVHYEIFKLGYGVFTQYNETGIVLSSDTASMVKATELIRDLVLPRLPKAGIYRPYSLVLVDSLYKTDYGWSSTKGPAVYGKPDYACKEMMGMVVGQLSDILKMSDDERAYWAGRILATNISSDIQEIYSDELDDFYMVSAKTTTSTYHGGVYYADLDGNPASAAHADYLTDYRMYGFTEWVFDGIYYPTMPTRRIRKYPSKPMDVTNYIAMVYAYDQEKFEGMYAAWPKCVEKYKIMKDIVARFEERISK